MKCLTGGLRIQRSGVQIPPGALPLFFASSSPGRLPGALLSAVAAGVVGIRYLLGLME